MNDLVWVKFVIVEKGKEVLDFPWYEFYEFLNWESVLVNDLVWVRIVIAEEILDFKNM